MRWDAALGVILAIVAGPTYAAGQPPPTAPTGRWRGTIEIGAGVLPFSVSFTTVSGDVTATIDIQGATGLRLQATRLVDDRIHFELPAGPGVAVFDGTVTGDTIAGTFTQGAGRGTFHLMPADAVTATPPPPLPYRVEDVTFSNGAVKLAGTLTIPPGPGPFKALVMVTGSGAQNRDEELFGFKIFGVIADHLSRSGIAVLRYDDRGVGGSTGRSATSVMADLAGDALSGIALLAARPDIDRAHIGILGHSEGALIAALAAARSPEVAFIVMMAGPAVPGDQVLARQQADGARMLGATDEEVAVEQAAFRKVVDAVRANATREVLQAAVRAQIDAQYDARSPAGRAALGDKNALVARALPGAVAQLQSPALRDLMLFDPAPVFARVRCPVLALFGGKDTQVQADVNVPAMRAAFAAPGHATLTVEQYADANHLFIPAKTGQASEYASLPKAFVVPFLDDVTRWVRALE